MMCEKNKTGYIPIVITKIPTHFKKNDLPNQLYHRLYSYMRIMMGTTDGAGIGDPTKASEITLIFWSGFSCSGLSF